MCHLLQYRCCTDWAMRAIRERVDNYMGRTCTSALGLYSLEALLFGSNHSKQYCMIVYSSSIHALRWHQTKYPFLIDVVQTGSMGHRNMREDK